MAELVVSPPSATIEQGQVVDLVVTADRHIDRLEWRDGNVPVGSITLRYDLTEPFTGWAVIADAPLTAVILSSDDDSAVIRVSWVSGVGGATANVSVSATGARSGLLSELVTLTLVVGEDIALSGNIGGTLAAGSTYRIVGNVTLTSDLIVEGTLVGIDTFTMDGQGLYQLLVQNGGRVNLAGVQKTGWLRWGETPVGWNNGDPLGVTPTKRANYFNLATTWGGSWGATTRPDAPDQTLLDGRIMKPEVANLSRSIVLQNLTRIHFHDGAGVQTLKWLKVLNCGVQGVLAMYPIHFHLNGEASRGSVVEGVLVEGGKNHAFVPHGVTGITFYDCVAWNTTNDAFWWDPPPASQDPINDSHEIVWDHCLVSGLVQTPSGSIDHRLSAFVIGAGNNNVQRDSVAACVRGSGQSTSGFLWRENFVWLFEDCVAHNVQKDGIFVWTNSQHIHPITRFVAYHFGRAGIEHGAYKTRFQYRDAVLMVTLPVGSGSGLTSGLLQHSNGAAGYPTGGLVFEDFITDDFLRVEDHGLAWTSPTIYRRVQVTAVRYADNDRNPSNDRYEDCTLVGGAPLAPANFTLTNIHPSSVIEIWRLGVLVHRWASGAWT